MNTPQTPPLSLEGFYLYTHVSGLALQAFHIQMAQFQAAEEAGAAPALPDAASLGAFLQNGYAAIDELSADIAAKLAQIPAAQLAELISQLPADLPALTRPLNGAQFYDWLLFVLEQPASAAIYQLHHLFNAGPLLDEDPAETIREAIAFDDPALLDASASIELEHVQLAIQANSLNVLPQLLSASELTDEDSLNLLALALTFDGAMPTLLAALKPSASLLARLKT
ncbi:MAG TPA: hypothetical protein PK011_15795, partial [Marinagarivorans sp.]|nr:hypothetical protein [Marinagarivorans sp.]